MSDTTRKQAEGSTRGLRSAVAMGGVVLGWAIGHKLIVVPVLSSASSGGVRSGSGPLGVGLFTLSESMNRDARACFFVLVAAAAVFLLTFAQRRAKGSDAWIAEGDHSWEFSRPWLLGGLLCTALLPADAIVCALLAAGLGWWLARVEGSPLDLPVAVATHAAAYLLGLASAYGLLHGHSLLATGAPLWGTWMLGGLPREILAPALLAACVFVLCARSGSVLKARPEARLLRSCAFVVCMALALGAAVALTLGNDYHFGWAQPNYAFVGAACCVFAMFRVLGSWDTRQRWLDTRGALAAGLLLHAGLAYGLGESVFALLILTFAAVVLGGARLGPHRHRASGLARKIRPSVWPW